MKNKISEKLKNATKASQRNLRISACGGSVKASTQVHKNTKNYSRKNFIRFVAKCGIASDF